MNKWIRRPRKSNPVRSWTSRLQVISVTVSCLPLRYTIKYFTTNVRYQSRRTSFDKFPRARRIIGSLYVTRNEPLKLAWWESPPTAHRRPQFFFSLMENKTEMRVIGEQQLRKLITFFPPMVVTFVFFSAWSVQTYSGSRYWRKPI